MDAGAKPDLESAKVSAKAAIKDLLKDPESAQFKEWTPFYKMKEEV